MSDLKDTRIKRNRSSFNTTVSCCGVSNLACHHRMISCGRQLWRDDSSNNKQKNKGGGEGEWSVCWGSDSQCVEHQTLFRKLSNGLWPQKCQGRTVPVLCVISYTHLVQLVYIGMYMWTKYAVTEGSSCPLCSALTLPNIIVCVSVLILCTVHILHLVSHYLLHSLLFK